MLYLSIETFSLKRASRSVSWHVRISVLFLRTLRVCIYLSFIGIVGLSLHCISLPGREEHFVSCQSSLWRPSDRTRHFVEPDMFFKDVKAKSWYLPEHWGLLWPRPHCRTCLARLFPQNQAFQTLRKRVNQYRLSTFQLPDVVDIAVLNDTTSLFDILKGIFSFSLI